MKVVVIGATGTIGAAVVDALESRHEVVRASRRGQPRVDLADPLSITTLFDEVPDADAVVCCAASAPLAPLTEQSDRQFRELVEPKLFGQVAVAINAVERLAAGGSVTLTAGVIPDDTPGSSAGALVNAGLEAFVRAAALDLASTGLRINAVSPGWVGETMAELGMDASSGTPASDVARAYVDAVEGEMTGQTLRPLRTPSGDTSVRTTSPE